MMIKEIWEDIVGYEGFYQVSNMGRVCSFRRSGTPGKIIKQAGVNRYLKVTLHKNNRHATRLVHHLVLEAFVSSRPEDMECCHFDGNEHNNQVTNLRWGTRRSNAHDKIRHGTDNRGEKHHMTTLSECDIREIRRLYTIDKWSQLSLGKRFKIGRTAISRIVTRKTWRYVE